MAIRRIQPILLSLLTVIVILAAAYGPLTVQAGSPKLELEAEDGWPMAGANPGRTSRTSEEVKGTLKPAWYKYFDAYIPQRVQIIATGSSLYLSTSQGLYALDAASGVERWFYPTSRPLGHSPTVSAGVAYVGGFDNKLHAVDTATGKARWTFTASAGFQTSPLVAESKVFAGSRDGHFYALNTANGSLAWKFKTGGPILYSAAYQDGTLYFASNDNHAYALRASDGQLIWKSPKLPGHGFHSFWPVVYRDYVVFSGSYNYRYLEPFPGPHTDLERKEAYPANASQGNPIGPEGSEPGEWIAGTKTIKNTAAGQYFEANPHRRTYFVLRRSNGQEYTYDADGDGKAEYAPILWFGTHSGTRYPPAIGPDGVLYQGNNLYYDPYIPRGRISGWKFGTPYVSVPSASATAVDEPIAYAVGGNTIYWKRCCDRMAGAFEIYSSSGTASNLQSWTYYDEGGKILRKTLPDLFSKGWNFAYWKHGDQSPPIPYRGKVYIIVNNAIVAFSPTGSDPVLGSLDQGSYTGEKADDILRSQSFAGLTTRTTLGNTAWPLLIQQETYYITDTSPDAKGRWFRLFEVAGSTASGPGSLTVEDKGLYHLLTSSFDGKTLKTRVSKRSPTTLFESSSSLFKLNGRLAGMAYSSGGQVKIVTSSATINGSALDAGWLLIWDSTQGHRWSPVVLSLQRKPNQISFSSSGLQISYPAAAGYLAATPLYGMSAPRSGEESAWSGGLPDKTVQRVKDLDRIARAFPETVSETQAIDSATGDVTVNYSYTFLEIANDWGSSARRLAYLPASMALAAWSGEGGQNPSPIRVNDKALEANLDLGYVTPLGRVAGVPDSSSAKVRLPGLARYWRGQPAKVGAYNSSDGLNQQLVSQVQSIVNAGHLRPAYGMVGIWEAKTKARVGDWLADYYHNPADTVYTLLQALPWLPADLQQQVRNYLQQEQQNYPLHNTAHVGWKSGANRYAFDLPSEVLSAAANIGASSTTDFNHWGLPPHNFYALWMYAREMGNASGLFSQAQSKLDKSPQFEASLPYVLNSYIAGYTGYLRLAELAGAAAQMDVEKGMVNLLAQRAALAKYPAALKATGFEYGGYNWAPRRMGTSHQDIIFTAAIAGSIWSQLPLYGFPLDNLYGLSGAATGGDYAFGIDFVNLTPELGNFLRDYTPNEARASLDDYTRRAPYWFVGEAAEAGGEGVFHPLYDRAAYFQARALVLQQTRADLEAYLDVPVMPLGDLGYIQNLVFSLRAPGPGAPAPTATTVPTVAPTQPPAPTATVAPTQPPAPTPTVAPTQPPPGPTATVAPTEPPAPTATPTPAPSSVIFSDGFEAGNLSAWSAVKQDGSDLAASPAAALAGGFGLQVAVNDNNNLYVSDERPEAEKRYVASYLFDPNATLMAGGNKFVMFFGYHANTTTVLRAEVRFDTGRYQMRASLLDDSSVWASTDWHTLSDEPHRIELDWRAATAAGANDGGLTLWIDGVQKGDLQGVDNDSWRIDLVQLGAVNGIDIETRGSFSFDAFESYRQSPPDLKTEPGFFVFMPVVTRQ